MGRDSPSKRHSGGVGGAMRIAVVAVLLTAQLAVAQTSVTFGKNPFAAFPRGRRLFQSGGLAGSGINGVAPTNQSTSPLATAAGDVTVPLPIAFFPLDGPRLESVLGNYSGAAMRATFELDPEAGLNALTCNSTTESSAMLSNVPYGRHGSWAINIWLKARGPARVVKRIFSNADARSQNTLSKLWGANQVKLYFPGTTTDDPADPYAGIVRAIVKDDNDIYIGEDTVTFLDSNGEVSNLANKALNASQKPANISDGRWHMITVSTRPEGGSGFQMYVDGDLAGSMEPGTLYTGSDNAKHVATGGGPMEISSFMYLCSDPAVNVPGQNFDGSLLELAIWDQALRPEAIKEFYQRHFAKEKPDAGGVAQAPTPTEAEDQQEKQLQNLLGFPDPVAYFPLMNGSLASNSNFGTKAYNGQGYNITWVRDDIGTVLACSKSRDSTVRLDPVAYGSAGKWAVSLWLKPSPAGLAGNQFEYILSHTNQEQKYTTGWEANQIRIYFPQLGHPAFGVLRALVKDTTEQDTSPAGQTFLDSDGFIGRLTRTSSSPALRSGASALQDGKWHMITLSTLANGRGYRMYLDGQQAGELNATTVQQAGFRAVDGGGPMALDGPLFLCGRSSQDDSRGYEGSLAELAIFNSSLNPSQVQALFYTGLGAPPLTSAAAVPPAPGPQVLPTQRTAPPSDAKVTDSRKDGSWTINGRLICLLKPIQGVPMQSCGDLEVCAGISHSVIKAAKLPADVKAGDVGICTLPPSGGLLLPSFAVVPPPRAFYPLTSNLNSYPLQLLSGNATGAYLVEDGPFGHAAGCRSSEKGLIRLDSVPFASEGHFSVNLWFRAGNVSGSDLQYIFSQADGRLAQSGAGPNQIQLLLPEQRRPAFGVLRAVVSDSDDRSNIPTFLDSDGRYTDDSQRSGTGPRTDPKASANDSFLTDGLWHMATITTQPNKTKAVGYRLYIDGSLRGEIVGGIAYKNANGTVLPVSGGQRLVTPGSLSLCSRYDDLNSSHFDGSLAYLGLYDKALHAGQVRALYTAVMNASAAFQARVNPLKRMTKSGKECAFPASARGALKWDDCTPINGVRACPLASNQWEACADLPPAAPEVQATSISPMSGNATNLPAQPGGNGTAAPPPANQSLMAQNGRQCVSPLDFGGRPVPGCITFAAVPGTPLCWVAGDKGDGSWNLCRSGSEVSVRGIVSSAAQTRLTSTKQPCVLPAVYQGEIVTDCINLDGSMACPAGGGLWAKCASKAPLPPPPRVPLVVPAYYQPNGFFVTNRTTASGDLCRLPVMYNGTVITNCAGGGGGYCVGTNSGQWEPCAPLQNPEKVTLQEIANSEAGFPAKGNPGGFCIPSKAEDNTGKARGCQPGLACIPLPVNSPVLANGVVVVADVANVGYCSPALQGAQALIRAYRPVAKYQVPQPMAFFPLTGGDLVSVTLPALEGNSFSVSWQADAAFESAMVCSKAANTFVRLPVVNFTAAGMWTLNLWFKRLPGQQDQPGNTNAGYIFSQSSGDGTLEATTNPNQIQVFMPARGDPAYGVVRTIVKDFRDTLNDLKGADPSVVLDTDGRVNNLNSKPWNTSDPNDGMWHMLTLSTHYFGFAGYKVFLDGKLVAQLDGNSVPVGKPDSNIMIGGGAPIKMLGTINLCSRSDHAGNLSFDGSVAHLALFDMPLTEGQIQQLYDAYKSGPDPIKGPPGPAVPGQASPPAAAPPPKDGVASASALRGSQDAAPSSKSKTGVILGGVLGGVAGALLMAIAAALLIRRRRRKRFVPFNEGSPAEKIDQMRKQSAKMELSTSTHISKLEAAGFKGNGFTGTLPNQMADNPAFEAGIPAAKASKWEEDSDADDGEMIQEMLDTRDSAMAPESRRAGVASPGRRTVEMLTDWRGRQSNPFKKLG